MAVTATPITLTAVGTVQPGGTVEVSDSLKNPYGLPMEIREIRFALWCRDGVASRMVPATIGVSISRGSEALTNGVVPVPLFTKSERHGSGDWGSERITETPGGGELRWRLAHPLFVPPAAPLTFQLEHRGLGLNEDVEVRITLVGRTFAQNYRPQSDILPWVSFWAAEPLTLNPPNLFDVGISQSSESQLTNPFGTPLKLQRLTGRIYVYNADVGQTNDDDEFAASLMYRHSKLRIDHSDGYHVVPKFSIFGSVFDMQRFSWEMAGAELPPKSYLKVYLEMGNPQKLNSTAYHMLGAVGWREA